ncbi:Dienelactone hydrolase family protein [compost metagenome]
MVAHGADDPFVPKEAVDGFQEAMRQAGVDWEFIAYGNAVHAFTNPAAGSDKSTGVAYEEKAATRSWNQMQGFFDEIFDRN